VSATNSTRKQWDINPGVGGPIQRDKLWFFGSYRRAGNRADSGVHYNLTPNAWVYTPDLSRPTASEENNDRSHYLRLTYQLTPRNKLAVLYDHQPRYWYNRGASATTSPEASRFDRYMPQYFSQFTWKSPLNSRLLLEAGTTYQNTKLHTFPNTKEPELDVVPRDLNAVSATDSGTGMLMRAANVYGNNLGSSRSLRSRAAASYVTGSHAFKVGLDLEQGTKVVGYYRNGDYNVTVRNGAPLSIQQWVSTAFGEERLTANLGLYAQDQWVLKRTTITAGLRFDYFTSDVPAQDVPGNRWSPAVHYDAVTEGLPHWKDVSPRFGVAYDLFGNGKTALKANLGRYVQGQTLGSGYGPFNPIARSVLSANRNWTDSNGNMVPDCDFTIQGASGECGALSDLNFGRANPRATNYDPAILEGFAVRPDSWETGTQIQHELLTGVSVNAGYYRRWFGRFRAQDNLAVTPADFDPFCLTLPVDSRLPGGGGNQLCGFYDISPAKFGQSQTLVTAASTYGEQTEVFNGWDVTVTARLPGGGQFTGGTSTGRTVSDTCFVIDSPATPTPSATGTAPVPPTGSSTAAQNKNFCKRTPPFQTQFKALGAYPLPWWGLQVSGTFVNAIGPEISAVTYQARNAEIAPTLGRNLASGANGTLTLPIMEPGTVWADSTRRVDLRFTKNVRIGRWRAQGNVDIFNVLNSSAVLAITNAYGPNWLKPTRVQTARFVQLSGQLDF
jgi:hypothetical protein